MKIADKVTYAYLKRIKKWIECPVCHKKMTYSNRKKSWICSNCRYELSERDYLDGYIMWFCDACGAYLNVQENFDSNHQHWICEKCGFDNDITATNIKGECRDCGKLLDDPNSTICDECKIKRLVNLKKCTDEMSKELKRMAEIIGDNKSK